jgi:hypothetical protein
MSGNGCTCRGAKHFLTGGALAAFLTGILVGAMPLSGSATRAGATSRVASRGAVTSASASAPATTAATATAASRPAIQADAILSKFPGNASLITARSDARNFTIEGRVRDVRTVDLDTNGIAIAPAAGGATATTGSGKTELRVVLVGRAQAADAPAHFTCRFDKASEEAAGDLKIDQIVRLTGTISAAATSGDRIDMTNCHDLSEVGPLNVGDQLAGQWRCSAVTVDGGALRKANQSRGIKNDDVPDMNYTSPWHIDLLVKSDNTLVAELLDTNGTSLKKVTGRLQVVDDSPAEARLRVSLQGTTATQEITATIDSGHLVLPLAAFADKCVLPDLNFSEVEGVPRPVDYKAYRDQVNQWFNANIAKSVPSLPQFVNTAIDQAAANRQGFYLTVGGGLLRRGTMTLLIANYGKLMPLELTEAESQFNATYRNGTLHYPLPSWGVPSAPEVKIETLAVDNRNGLDPAKPLTGKIVLRNLRRRVNGTYVLGITSPLGTRTINIDPPGPDARVYDFRFDPQTSVTPNPRPVLFFVGRMVKGGDAGPGGANRVISDPAAVLVDISR